MSVSRQSVDFDTHFWQPVELWQDCIAAEHASAVLDYFDKTSPLRTGRFDKKIRDAVAEKMMEPAADDPHERLRWMDANDIVTTVIFPSHAQFSFAADPEVAAAGCRALNRWASQFAAPNRARLKPTMMLPVMFPELALEEFRYASEELGLEVVFICPTPNRDRRWSDESFDPLWAAMQDAGTVLTFHEFTRIDAERVDLQTVARPSYKDLYPLSYVCGHTVELQLVVADLIAGGMLERFPELPVGVAEGHVAWLPGWLALLDDLWPNLVTRFGQVPAADQTPPSEVFKRQCFAVAFPNDTWIEQTARSVSPDVMVVCSDFPHPNGAGRMPLEATLRASSPGLSEGEVQQLLQANAARILRLPAAV
jgi:predicted TIM-barrel fold metal-dependent hydrolase